MTVEKFIFYFFALILIVAAGRVITARNPVHAALFLVLAFFSSAAIWLLLHAEFLAIALILVYVGAVMVLFLFVVMMLDINIAVIKEGFARYAPVSFIVGVIIFVQMAMVVGYWQHEGAAPEVENAIPNTEALGQVLYTTYVYPFEIAAVILLVAMIAAIALTMRPPRADTKRQDIDQQVRVKAADRVKLVDVPVETDKKVN